MVRALRNLNYLDDRPVYEYERLIADAFARGGEEEEAKVKQEMQDKKAAEENARRAFGKEHNEKGKKFRKDMFKKMLSELKDDKGQLIEKRDELKKEYHSMSDQNIMKPHTLNKITKID
jgi:hypothetical protein